MHTARNAHGHFFSETEMLKAGGANYKVHAFGFQENPALPF